LASGCAPSAELEAAPAAAPAHAGVYLAAPTCGPAKVTALRELLPDDEITGALEVDVQHLQRGKLFPEVERLLKAEGADVLDAMNACGVPLAKVEGVVAGFSEHDDVVMGIKAKGVGEVAALDCLAKKIETVTGKAPWRRVTRGCSTTLEVPDGEAKGFVVGRDIVVFASKSLEGAMERRVQGKDRSALDGRLGWVRGEVDMGSTAWMASRVPAGTGGALSPSMAGVARVGMSIDATRGLGLRLGAGFASAADAKTAASELEAQLATAKMMLPMMGLPATAADTIELAAKGNVVRMAMFLSLSDLEALRATIEGARSGSGGSPPSPPRRRGL